MRYVALAFSAVVATSSSCSCGDPLVVTDAFAAPADLEGGEHPESIQRYATNSRVPWQVRSTGGVDINDIEIVAADGLTIDDDPAVKIDGDVLSASILTGDAGTGTVIFKDKESGEIIASRDVEVVEVDELEADITAPKTDGLDLPELDIARVRIATGRSAAFRVNLFADGQPVYGLESVDAVADDDQVTTSQRSGCAEEGCESSAMATLLTVGEGELLGGGDVDVVLSAGSASLTLTVVPTDVDDVTEIVIDEPSNSDVEVGENTGVIVRVNVGDEPLFGAPVTWTVDGTAVEGSGDAASYKLGDGGDVTLNATLGDNTATVQVKTAPSDVQISSVTSACTQSGGAPWYAAFGAALLLLRRRRA